MTGGKRGRGPASLAGADPDEVAMRGRMAAALAFGRGGVGERSKWFASHSELDSICVLFVTNQRGGRGTRNRLILHK